VGAPLPLSSGSLTRKIGGRRFSLLETFLCSTQVSVDFPTQSYWNFAEYRIVYISPFFPTSHAFPDCEFNFIFRCIKRSHSRRGCHCDRRASRGSRLDNPPSFGAHLTSFANRAIRRNSSMRRSILSNQSGVGRKRIVHFFNNESNLKSVPFRHDSKPPSYKGTTRGRTQIFQWKLSGLLVLGLERFSVTSNPAKKFFELLKIDFENWQNLGKLCIVARIVVQTYLYC